MMMKLARYALALTVALSASLALAEAGSEKTFDSLKALAGTWEGKNLKGEPITITFRETSGGSALMSEIHGMKQENMISMIHVDGSRLLMTHYCGFGNQPRMSATLAPDGKSVAFDFVDATNLASPVAGHMQHVVFGMPDADHHTEEWTFLDHGKELKEVFTLARSK
jgi:hypothetical protein